MSDPPCRVAARSTKEGGDGKNGGDGVGIPRLFQAPGERHGRASAPHLVTRHGQRLGAYVSDAHLEFLEKHKPQPTLRPVDEKLKTWRGQAELTLWFRKTRQPLC